MISLLNGNNLNIILSHSTSFSRIFFTNLLRTLTHMYNPNQGWAYFGGLSKKKEDWTKWGGGRNLEHGLKIDHTVINKSILGI